jgi:2-polyprenyl-3-methyl-5-hydroxy-6-metoxy-1,4-benzoquinol methylase
MITSQSTGQTGQMDVETRARQSQGASSKAIYEMVARTIATRQPNGGVLVDVGCGAGNLLQHMDVGTVDLQLVALTQESWFSWSGI